jgi:hypothetical protein
MDNLGDYNGTGVIMPVPTTRGSRNDVVVREQSEYSVSQSEDGGFSPMIGRFQSQVERSVQDP